MLILLLACQVENDLQGQNGLPGAGIPPMALPGAALVTPRATPVMLDGTASFDPDDEEAQLSFEWEVVEAPDEAVWELTDGDSARPSFVADLTGSYVVSLDVVDADGWHAQNAAETVVEVVPYRQLEVSLDWEEADVDLDLHVIAPGGSYYGPGDCFSGNPEPDWGVVGALDDDPVLSTDDEGIGVGETVAIAHPVDGTYLVAVHLVNTKGQTVTVEPHVLVHGEARALASVYGDSLDRTDDVLQVGRLDWTTLGWDLVDVVTTHSLLGGPPLNESEQQ